ncbi:MAG: hydantoinase B/oxoprolinase family protein, partial [Desulfobacteraceae bacterium]
MTSVPQILKEFPTCEMKEGDAYVANDPYSGGTQLPDITMVVPDIYQAEVVALNCSMIHHQDIVG